MFFRFLNRVPGKNLLSISRTEQLSRRTVTSELAHAIMIGFQITFRFDLRNIISNKTDDIWNTSDEFHSTVGEPAEADRQKCEM